MRAAAALIAALSLSGCAAWATMDRTDVGLEATHAAVTAGDMVTTYSVVDNCSEANPILGRCGRGMPIPLYFALYQGLHLALVLTLPPGKARTIAQALMIGVEGCTVYRNVMRQSEEGRLGRGLPW